MHIYLGVSQSTGLLDGIYFLINMHRIALLESLIGANENIPSHETVQQTQVLSFISTRLNDEQMAHFP